MISWLRDAIFYQIYPQSFYDSNADGIGDFRGIEEKLSYLEDLGVNAIWMNPCFDSSFFDAGYDVRDYFSTAPRYGSNEDLKHLFEAVAPQVIAEKRRIIKGVSPNVDFYSGFVYELLGIPKELYTAFFAIARVVGWSAHRIEELICMDKIIRPAYLSVMDEKE